MNDEFLMCNDAELGSEYPIKVHITHEPFDEQYLDKLRRKYEKTIININDIYASNGGSNGFVS